MVDGYKEPAYIPGGCTYELIVVVVLCRTFMQASTKQNNIPLLDVQSYHKDTCPTMFIEAMFVIVRTWEPPKCLSTEEWIKKMWYIYTME